MDLLSIAALGIIAGSTAYAFLRKAPLSLAYAIAAIVIFVLEVATVPFGLGLSFLGASRALGDLGLAYGPGILPDPWTWASFQFVHGGIDHLFLNLLAFLFIAPVLEERIGPVRWALLFFLGGAAGALLFVLLEPGPALLVGASAGLLALFAAYGRLYPRERVHLFLPLPGMPGLPVLTVVIGFLALQLLLSLRGPSGVAWSAHVGGMLFGFATAPVLMRLPLPRGRSRKRVEPGSLRGLATTPELRTILEEIEHADVAEVREAWVARFLERAICPTCGGPLRLRGRTLASGCGWKARLG